MMRYSSQAPHARITSDNGDLCLDTSYDAGLVFDLKAQIPASDRAYDGQRRVWNIKASHGQTLIKLCQTYLGITPDLPASAPTSQAVPQIRVIRLEYLGQCKQREDGSVSAMGYTDGAWSVIAPESVLRYWFEGHTINVNEPARPVQPDTLYGLLGVPQSADSAAIKAGYRRMARQWHPDACTEPGAGEFFLKIKAAYDALADPIKRKKYDAGLTFQREEDSMPSAVLDLYTNYRAPLRCGLIIAEALPVLGRWRLTTIHSWQDIVGLDGRIMVASWHSEEQRIRTEWVAV